MTVGSAGYLAALTERFRDLIVNPVWELTRQTSGPLHPGFIRMLADVERAGTELVYETGRNASVALRAAGDHEETVLEYPSGTTNPRASVTRPTDKPDWLTASRPRGSAPGGRASSTRTGPGA